MLLGKWGTALVRLWNLRKSNHGDDSGYGGGDGADTGPDSDVASAPGIGNGCGVGRDYDSDVAAGDGIGVGRGTAPDVGRDFDVAGGAGTANGDDFDNDFVTDS